MKLLIENWRVYLNEDIEKTLREWELLVHNMWEANNSPDGATMEQYEELETLELKLLRPNGPYDPQELRQMKDKVEREGTSIPPGPEDPDAEWMDDRHREDQEDWPEEEVVDLRGVKPNIGRLKRKLKYGWEDWRK